VFYWPSPVCEKGSRFPIVDNRDSTNYGLARAPAPSSGPFSSGPEMMPANAADCGIRNGMDCPHKEGTDSPTGSPVRNVPIGRGETASRACAVSKTTNAGLANHRRAGSEEKPPAKSMCLRRSAPAATRMGGHQRFGACEEFPTAACQKCPTLFCSEGSPELKER
jgi:hypothetical protein